MWEQIKTKPVVKNSSMHFSEWMNVLLSKKEIHQSAEDTLEKYKNQHKEIQTLLATPQSPPWHGEGLVVEDHLTRILSGVLGIVEGGMQILDIEEFRRERMFRLEFEELQQTIQEHAGLFMAFTLLHDIAKPKTLSFTAPESSLGAKEGFHSSEREVATEAQIALYQKLLRRHAELTGKEGMELAHSFYDEYEIRCHYDAHGRMGASDEFFDLRESISDDFHLSERDRKLLTLLIKVHLSFVLDFSAGKNVARYHVAMQWANKHSVDADDFLDLLLAAVFLDVVIGGVVYEDGQVHHQTEMILAILQSEREAHGERSEKRRVRKEELIKKQHKALRKQVGLDAEALFALFEAPFGPERNSVLEGVDAYMSTGEVSAKIEPYLDELAKRVKKYHELLTCEGVSENMPL